MADVTIAYFNGTHWLVAGEIHLMAILKGDEPADMAIEFVDCTSWAEVTKLHENPDEPPTWQINPKIIERLKDRHLRVKG